jgi:hypothetical protein
LGYFSSATSRGAAPKILENERLRARERSIDGFSQALLDDYT